MQNGSNFRNKKLSGPIIQETLKYINCNHKNIQFIIAEIKAFNIASIKCFKKNGFYA